eukprot:Nk52_evm20s280 gene=Nk52_evmTU20s280
MMRSREFVPLAESDDDDIDMEYGPMEMTERLTRVERLTYSANRFLVSSGYYVVCAINIALILIVMIWTIFKKYPKSPYFFMIEIIINTILVAEVSIRILAMGWRTYFQSWFNRFDVFVTSLCLITFVVYLIGAFQTGEAGGSYVEEIIASLILVIRNLLMIFRLAILLNDKRKQTSSSANVDFLRMNRRESISNLHDDGAGVSMFSLEDETDI